MKLRDVAKLLGYKCVKSALRWCKNNEVGVHNHIGSRRKHVLAQEFYWAWYGKIQYDAGLHEKNISHPEGSEITHRTTHIKIKKSEFQHENYYKARLQLKLREL